MRELGYTALNRLARAGLPRVEVRLTSKIDNPSRMFLSIQEGAKVLATLAQSLDTRS